MYLYHATYRANLPGIKSKGLGAPGRRTKSWSISESGWNYFDTNPEIAFSYAESAEDVSDYKYDSGIIVLAVNTDDIPNYPILPDNNTKDGLGHAFKIGGIIPPHLLQVATRKHGVLGYITLRTKVPSYE